MARGLLALGSVVMALAVALGAYASHAGKAAPHPDAARLLGIAVLYMMVHGLGLVAAGLVARHGGSRWLAAAGALFTIGIVFFCGSLWVLAMTTTSLGPVPPIGGTAFILGWLALAAHAFNNWGQR